MRASPYERLQRTGYGSPVRIQGLTAWVRERSNCPTPSVIVKPREPEAEQGEHDPWSPKAQGVVTINTLNECLSGVLAQPGLRSMLTFG